MSAPVMFDERADTQDCPYVFANKTNKNKSVYK